jgi:uncharacterized membrane protein
VRTDQRIRSWVEAKLIAPDLGERLLGTLTAEERAPTTRALGTAGLVLLCSGVNGAVILLFTALYGIDVPAHVPFLLWMLCVGPLVYVLRIPLLAALLVVLLLVWIGLFIYGSMEFLDIYDRVRFVPLAYLPGGILAFALGGMHYLLGPLATVARAYRLAGLLVTVLAMFALGMSTFGGSPTGMVDWRRFEASNRFLMANLGLCGAAALATIVNMTIVRKRTPELTTSEGPISLAMLGIAALYSIVPLPAGVYLTLWNLVLLALTGAVAYVGWVRADLRLAQIGAIGGAAMLCARWLDLSWGHASLVTTLLVEAGLVAGSIFGVGGLLRDVRRRAAEEKPDAPATDEKKKKVDERAVEATTTSIETAPSKPAGPLDADPEIAQLLTEMRARKQP